MRAITQGEYDRMQSQTESNFKEMSMVSIEMNAKEAGVGTDVYKWYETGFMCNANIGATDESTIQERPYSFGGTKDVATITLAFPFRYLKGDGLTIQQNGLHNGERIVFYNGAFGLITLDTEIAPVARNIVLIEYNGLRISEGLSPTKFVPTSLPVISADGYQLQAVGDTVNWQFYYVDNPLWHQNGILSHSSRLGSREVFGTRDFGTPGSGDPYRSRPFKR